MKKETAVQVKSEIEKVVDEICKLEYHLVGLDSEKQKTKRSLKQLKCRLEGLKSYR